MRKYKKSLWLTTLLFIYVTAMAIYFLPRNTQTSDLEKYLTVGGAYIIIFLLWFVLRRKERLVSEREQNLTNKEQSNKQN